MFKTLHSLRVLIVGALLLPVTAIPSRADAKADIQAEAEFASGLVDLRFPEYAQKVVDGISSKHGAAAKLEVSRVRIKIMTAKGDFQAARDEVSKLTADDAETMGIKLALADQLFNWNKLKEARELYDSFFKKYPQGPPPAMDRFYGESAYKYAQMLTRLGDYVNAVAAYRYILLTKLDPKDLELRVKTEMCELIIRAIPKVTGPEKTKFLEEAVALASEVQWSGQESIWFWRTVVVLAHVEMVKGNNAGARKIILAYMPGLDEAEKLLSKDRELMKLSPMAECRYLMGTLCEDYARELLGKNLAEEAKKNLKEALIHYFTVLLKYPSSSWAMDARKHVDDIVKLTKAQGWKTPVLPKIDNSQFAAEQLKEARLLFQNGDFSNAADKYREVLSIYFDRPGMVSAVGELARCYIETETTERNPPYFSRAIAGYVADRYCQNTNLYEEAGNTLLLIAGAFENRADRESADQVSDMYFDKFSNHKLAVKAVLHKGAVALRTTNYVDALKYYQLIAVKYTNSPSATDAIGLAAMCYARLEDHTNSILWYSNYVAKLPWSIEQAIGIRRMADEYQIVGKLVPALNEYNRLVYLLTNRGDKIEFTPDNEAKKKDALEWGLYQKASCYYKLRTPADRIPYYQTNALNAYTEFVERYRKSDMAPKALGAMAILYSLQGKQKEANDMFQRLQDEWPNDEYTQNIVFMRLDNFLKLGRTNDAIQAASSMLDKPAAFKPDQFYQVAELLLSEKMYQEASRAFVLARATQNSNVWQLASFGLGRACFETGLYEEAAKPLEEILAKNKRSAYTREVCLMLSRCYAEAGKKEADKAKQDVWFGKAYDNMNRACRLIRPEEKKARMEAELELAAIQTLQNNKLGAAATYQRVFMFGDAADPTLRPFVGKAFELGTQLLKDLDKYQDVKENCESYLQQFPNGPAKGRANDWLIWANSRLGTGP